MENVCIIGAGAAGCLAAIELKRRSPGTSVTVLEAGPRPLAKVALTGGGRCNLTNTFACVGDLREAYPRGFRLMKGALRAFGPEDTMRWFEDAGVRLVEEDVGRIFPASGDAMEIVRTLLREMKRLGVEIRCRTRVTGIQPCAGGYSLTVEEAVAGGQGPKDCSKEPSRGMQSSQPRRPATASAVLVATGGGNIAFLTPLNLAIEPPVPSLFTMKTGDAGLKALMGTVAPDAVLSLPGTPFRSAAPLLLTDWGLGGPATLKLSSYALWEAPPE